MILTDEQKAVLEAARKEKRVVVEALAGTGKTGTAFEAMQNAASVGGRVLYLCFNRANVLAMKDKLEKAGFRADSYTIHGLAWKFLGSKFKVETGGSNGVLNLAMKLWTHSLDRNFNAFQDRFIAEYKKDILEAYTIDEFYKVFKYVWERDNAYAYDRCLKKFYLDLDKYLDNLRYDMIIVDEAQDMFPLAIDLVTRINAYYGNLAVFGDSFQQIYAWNLSANAMGIFSENAQKMALTRSFRCSAQVVEAALPWLRLLGYNGEFIGNDHNGTVSGKAIVSRDNAGLLDACASLLSEGYDPGDIFMLADEGIDKYSPRSRKFTGAVKVDNVLKCLREEEFAPDMAKAQVVIGTVHRLKGMEFDECEMWDSFGDPLKLYMREKAWNSIFVLKWPREELRINYVALTRASGTVWANGLDLGGGKMEKLEKVIEKGGIDLTGE